MAEEDEDEDLTDFSEEEETEQPFYCEATRTLSQTKIRISKCIFPRRIIAEDPFSSFSDFPSLKDICLDFYVANPSGICKLRNIIPSHQWNYILQNIPVNTSILKAIEEFIDERYWKRRCEANWGVLNVNDYENNWKIMCIQRTLEDKIESFRPGESNLNEILQIASLSKKYITKLNIKQLLAKKPENKKAEEETTEDTENHFNFELLFKELTSIRELHVTYGERHCGIDFDWHLFEFTDADCQKLLKAIQLCENLEVLHIHNSGLDDDKTNILATGFEKLENLHCIDFSYNDIGDRGVMGLINVLIDFNLLVEIRLINNHIGFLGAKAFAYALTKTTSLKVLNLRLNRIGENGGKLICKSLAANSSLTDLNLASNELGEGTAEVLSVALKLNKTLKNFDISCNTSIGEIGGIYILEGMELNSTIVTLDLRLCNLSQESEYYIERILDQNRVCLRH